ncbi:Tnfaip3-interacting protein like [Thalictrum thalictroides]|uniref:Tnfaip3-interacting protein like n=1 Tax=Thalictrum thalictroides TaxID=46969 RepID=A0A7J6W5E9_THATH|nr:Tnfaip3-interacting protein like [Thalictrum thalictroides]
MISRRLLGSRRLLHSSPYDGPSETLKKEIAKLEMKRKKMKILKKDDLFVEVRESTAYLDTMKLPMVLTFVAVALFAKLLMMYDESKSQEMIERKIRNAPAGQGTTRMLSREEWDEIQEVRPRTPFESKMARPNARLRTDETIRKEDLKDWSIDVLTDALTRAEEIVRRTSK